MNKHIIKIPTTNGNHIESIELPFYFKSYDVVHGIIPRKDGYRLVRIADDNTQGSFSNCSELPEYMIENVQSVLKLEKYYTKIHQTVFLKKLVGLIENVQP